MEIGAVVDANNGPNRTVDQRRVNVRLGRAFGSETIDGANRIRMTQNRKTVEAYMDSFRRADRAHILSCLTHDVEWVIPGTFHAKGKDEFARHIVDDGFVGRPTITILRMLETDEAVVAEGTVRAPKQDGSMLDLAFCDVFDMRGGKIRRLTSYLMQTK